jgi:hypothetical protein
VRLANLDLNMDEAQRAQIFEAQTTNVRDLNDAWDHLNRQTNVLIIQKNDKGVQTTTKLLAFVYCALAEAIFSKLLHTPGVLTLDEIDQVKEYAKNNGVKFGWSKCAELAVRKIDGTQKAHPANVLQTLRDLIEQYIFDPSVTRNKLAHGQWTVALNRENDALNPDATAAIATHSVVELARRKHALEALAGILEDIIESPNKAHRRDYWGRLTQFKEKQKEMSRWTFERKVAALQKKKSFNPLIVGSAARPRVPT